MKTFSACVAIAGVAAAGAPGYGYGNGGYGAAPYGGHSSYGTAASYGTKSAYNGNAGYKHAGSYAKKPIAKTHSHGAYTKSYAAPSYNYTQKPSYRPTIGKAPSPSQLSRVHPQKQNFKPQARKVIPGKSPKVTSYKAVVSAPKPSSYRLHGKKPAYAKGYIGGPGYGYGK